MFFLHADQEKVSFQKKINSFKVFRQVMVRFQLLCK